MSSFDPLAYGPVFAPLLAIHRRRPLDVGNPDFSAHASLKMLSIETGFAHLQSEFGKRQPVDDDMAECCVSAVWLVHDYLDESHNISQGIDTPSGSFWHAIMHRREGDFSNAKYWFRRVGSHPVYEAIGQRAGELAASRGAERAINKLISGTWDAMAFVDLCEKAVGGQGRDAELCLDIQQAEWELLFDDCYRTAVGEPDAALQ